MSAVILLFEQLTVLLVTVTPEYPFRGFQLLTEDRLLRPRRLVVSFSVLMIVVNELERILDSVRHLPEGSVESSEKPQSEQRVVWPICDPGAYRGTSPACPALLRGRQKNCVNVT